MLYAKWWNDTQIHGYVETILQEMKTPERKRISWVDTKQTCLQRVISESGT
jgi:hypothetical protein